MKKSFPVAFFYVFGSGERIHFCTFFYDFAEKWFWTLFLCKEPTSRREAPRKVFVIFFGAKRRKNLLDLFSSARRAEKGFFCIFFAFSHLFTFFIALGNYIFCSFFLMVLVKKVFYSPDCGLVRCGVQHFSFVVSFN